jgi:hypothetical protein
MALLQIALIFIVCSSAMRQKAAGWHFATFTSNRPSMLARSEATLSTIPSEQILGDWLPAEPRFLCAVPPRLGHGRNRCQAVNETTFLEIEEAIAMNQEAAKMSGDCHQKCAAP